MGSIPAPHNSEGLSREHVPSVQTAPAGQTEQVKGSSVVVYMRGEHMQSVICVIAEFPLVSAPCAITQMVRCPYHPHFHLTQTIVTEFRSGESHVSDFVNHKIAQG